MTSDTNGLLRIDLSPQAAEWLARKYAEAEVANAALQSAFSAILRMQGYTNGTLVGLDGTTLSARLPNGAP